MVFPNREDLTKFWYLVKGQELADGLYEAGCSKVNADDNCCIDVYDLGRLYKMGLGNSGHDCDALQDETAEELFHIREPNCTRHPSWRDCVARCRGTEGLEQKIARPRGRTRAVLWERAYVEPLKRRL